MAWPRAVLGDFLSYRKEFITIDDDVTYSRCRVQTDARGVILRDKITGSHIRTKTQQVCRAGDFIVAEIDAKAGGYGTVPSELHGAIVSSHYFLFDIDENFLSGEFLDWYCRTSEFRGQVSARGSTNYASVRPSQVLRYTIPLPALPEQQRIASKLGNLSCQLEKHRSLVEAIDHDARAMLSSAFSNIISGAPRRPIADVAPLVRRPVVVEPGRSFPELGIRSFGRGSFHKPPIDGATVGSKRLFLIQEGDLLFNIVFAWEGAVAVARAEDHGRVGSHRFLTCVPDRTVTTSTFLSYYFLTTEGLDQLDEASPGGAGRNRTLGLKKLHAISVPVPSIDRQLWFDRVQNLVREMDVQRIKVGGEVSALRSRVLRAFFTSDVDS